MNETLVNRIAEALWYAYCDGRYFGGPYPEDMWDVQDEEIRNEYLEKARLILRGGDS